MIDLERIVRAPEQLAIEEKITKERFKAEVSDLHNAFNKIGRPAGYFYDVLICPSLTFKQSVFEGRVFDIRIAEHRNKFMGFGIRAIWKVEEIVSGHITTVAVSIDPGSGSTMVVEGMLLPSSGYDIGESFRFDPSHSRAYVLGKNLDMVKVGWPCGGIAIPVENRESLHNRDVFNDVLLIMRASRKNRIDIS